MKRLTLVRHAKSSWKDADVADFERRLNKRGERDAPVMAERFARVEPPPDQLVSSPARRALETARVFARALGREEGEIEQRPEIYDASPGELLAVVQGFDDALSHVALVGHNPGIAALAELLTAAGVRDVPTCAVLRLELEALRWCDAAPGGARLLALDTPKSPA